MIRYSVEVIVSAELTIPKVFPHCAILKSNKCTYCSCFYHMLTSLALMSVALPECHGSQVTWLGESGVGGGFGRFGTTCGKLPRHRCHMGYAVDHVGNAYQCLSEDPQAVVEMEHGGGWCATHPFVGPRPCDHHRPLFG